jgi:hypothetical protein
MFLPFQGAKGLISQGALHEICYMSSMGEIDSMEIAVGASSPLTPTAATPYTVKVVAKMAPAFSNLLKSDGWKRNSYAAIN